VRSASISELSIPHPGCDKGGYKTGSVLAATMRGIFAKNVIHCMVENTAAFKRKIQDSAHLDC
jgi:hypothetical protein